VHDCQLAGVIQETQKLSQLLEEVSRLLNAYIKAILTPGS
jgi:hypothetical protein